MVQMFDWVWFGQPGTFPIGQHKFSEVKQPFLRVHKYDFFHFIANASLKRLFVLWLMCGIVQPMMTVTSDPVSSKLPFCEIIQLSHDKLEGNRWC